MMNKQQIKTINREFRRIQRQEEQLMVSAIRRETPHWKASLEEKVPEKVYTGLNSAFYKAFSLVFQHGQKLIEKTYSKETLAQTHRARNALFVDRGVRGEMKRMHRGAKQANRLNLAITTAEGIGLGALGVGMPDIVLFLAMTLRGIYETALHYGIAYESRFEQMLILKMMAAALSTGENWFHRNKEVNDWLLAADKEISDADFEEQLRDTAQVFAMDMLLLKFVQGLPVVGILGGAANPVYYHKILRYVQIKYRKRYLLTLSEK